MKKTFFCSILFLLVATLSSAQLPSSPLPIDRSKLKKIKCKVVQRDANKTHCMRACAHPTAIGSTNWAGYAVLTNLKNPQKCSVELVSGTWIVPELTPSVNNSIAAVFVGIDGATIDSQTVEQIGTDHTWIGGLGGSQIDTAWFELFPGPAFSIIDFPLQPGQLVGGEVAYIDNDKFQLTLVNFSLGVFFVVKAEAPGARRETAEWIVEAPSDGTTILPLANFGVIPFTHCLAKLDNDTGSISDDDWKHTAIVMVSEDGSTIKATPTKLKQDGEAFIVAWQAEGP